MRTARPIDVLLVEDDAGDVELTREALAETKLSLNLHVVEDGEQALAFLRREPPYRSAPRPDLIMLDLNLPRIDGREVLRQVKLDDSLRQIPVVVLTTSEAEADIVRTYDLGANCYVTKPLGFEGFLSVIRAIEQFWLTIVKLPRRPREGRPPGPTPPLWERPGAGPQPPGPGSGLPGPGSGPPGPPPA